MNQIIPEYLHDKSNLIKLVLYTALFALIFINIYQPFDSKDWFEVSEFMYFVFSSLIILTGMLVVAVSRLIMFYRGKRGSIFVWQYACWILAEIVSMALFYTLFEKIILHDARPFREMMKESSINTALVLLLPYTTLWLYFTLRDRNKKLEQFIQQENPSEPSPTSIMNFYDEKKELKLSVRSDQVLWIESADNYIKINYLNKGKIYPFMIRNALKTIEEQFAGSNLLRCNRSTIVNFEKVKVLKKEKDGVFLCYDLENIPDFQVSKTYAGKVMARFSEYPA